MVSESARFVSLCLKDVLSPNSRMAEVRIEAAIPDREYIQERTENAVAGNKIKAQVPT